MDLSGILTISWYLLWPVMSIYQIYLISSNSWGTVLFLKKDYKCPKHGGRLRHQRSQNKLLKIDKMYSTSDDIIAQLEILDFNGILSVSCHLRLLGISGYHINLSSSNSGVTVILLKNMLRTQSSGAGRDTREFNIECWRVAKSPLSVMRG